MLPTHKPRAHTILPTAQKKMAANAPASILYRKIYKMPHLNLPPYSFLPPRPLRQGRWGLTEKVLTSRNSRFAKLSISCFQPTSPRSHTILPTAQRENGCAVIALRAYAPAPNQQQGLDRKNTVNKKGLD